MDERGSRKPVALVSLESEITPEKFDETFLQDLARRMNGVRRDAAWHFECALFLQDVVRLAARPAPARRRA